MADIIGDNQDNVLDGTSDNDTIRGKGGDDIITGGAGQDTLNGGDGDDTIYADDNTDNVDGGAGNDTIYGGGDNDNLGGGDDADTFIINSTGTTGSTNTTVNGGSGGDDYDTLDLSALLSDGFEITNFVQNGDSDGYSGQISLFNSSTCTWANLNYSDIENFVLCFTPGSLIATAQGGVVVEALKVGDKVVTRDNGLQEIRWIGEKFLTKEDFLSHEQLTPILIQRGALGEDLPARDMMVSPQHRVLITSQRAELYFEEHEVLVPAVQLVGLPGVSRAEPLFTSYIHFLCDHHEVVLSDGVWTETFQPGIKSMNSLQRAQREEVVSLFPALATLEGVADYGSARKTLKRYESSLLLLQS